MPCSPLPAPEGAHGCAPAFLFFFYKDSKNILQDPTRQSPLPATYSPDVKPQQQGNEDPCGDKGTVRGQQAAGARQDPQRLRGHARGDSALSWHKAPGRHPDLLGHPPAPAGTRGALAGPRTEPGTRSAPAAPSEGQSWPRPLSSVLTWNYNVSQTQHGKVVGIQSLLQQVLRENHCEGQRRGQGGGQ